MTLVLAFANKHLALAASDTRSQHLNGDGAVLRTSDQTTKLHRMDGAWLVGGGSPLVRQAICDALDDIHPDAIRATLQRIRPQLLEMVDSMPAVIQPKVRAGAFLWLICPSAADGFTVWELDWTLATCIESRHMVNALNPVGSDPGELGRYIAERESVALQALDVPAAIAWTRELFQHVRRRVSAFGTVGPELEIGVLSLADERVVQQRASFAEPSEPAYALDSNTGKPLRSTAWNDQGVFLPIPFSASLFTGAWGGIGAGQMFVAFSWAAQTLRLPDGSTIAMPSSTAALTMTALGQQAGGTRGATTLWARIGLVKDGHVSSVSSSSSLAVNANNVLTVTSPSSVAGYDGWCVLVGTGSTTVFLQESGGTPFPIAFGTNYTEPTAHFSTVAAQYTSAWLNALVYVDLNPSTVYYFYPTYDIALGFARFFPAGDAIGDTAPSMVDANLAWQDGRIALSGASMTVSVGAGGGSGSSPTGGSRLT